jgi:uncharacterized repeat protein (TIGR02543 family)
MLSLKKRLPVLVLLCGLVFSGCNYFDLGDPRRNEGQETQPKAGVLTVKGVENGTHHEAAVYDYPDDDVADAADLIALMSQFELVAIGLGTAGNKTLAIGLLTPDGEDFTSDGKFLLVLKDETDDSAPLKYKAAVPFTGGSATLLKYRTLNTATRLYTVTFDLNYTDAPKPPKPQEIDADGNITPPAEPERTGWTFGGWFTDAAGTGAAWDFDKNTVTTNLDLYAKWTRNTYKVTFDTGDTAHTPDPLDVQYEDKITAPVITKTGYTLDGWYKENTKTTSGTSARTRSRKTSRSTALGHKSNTPLRSTRARAAA